MPPMTIRDLDAATEARLRRRADNHGRSIEDEARDILRAALSVADAGETPPPHDLATGIRARFAPLGGVDLPDIPRPPSREPPDFAA